MWQVHGFITPALWLGFQIARQQIGRIRLNDQPVGGNLSHHLAQVQAASFVADPAGDADVQVEIQIGTDFVHAGREAMRDTTHQARAVLLQDRDEIFVGVALMQEYRFAQRNRQLQLAAKCVALRVARREIPEIVEPAFTHCNDLRCSCQRGEFQPLLCLQLARMVGMDPGRTSKPLRMVAHEFDSGATAGNRTAGDDHSSDASVQRAFDDGIAIGIEAVVTQVQADIDECRGRSQCEGLEIGGQYRVVSFSGRDCSQKQREFCMSEWRSGQVLKRRPTLLGALLMMLSGAVLCVPAVYADAVSDLDDAASRTQYAFYTGDARGLEEMQGLIERLEVPATLASMKAYFAAYANWKLAQLYTDEASRPAAKTSARGHAGKAAQTCVRHIESALKLDPRMAEAYAINAICSALAPGLTVTSCARSKALRTALELESANPRVRFIEMLCSTEKADASSTQIEKLRTLVTTFESAPPSAPGKPDWGQAEVLVLLGQRYLERGDPLAARDAIERALVIAPDFRKAQELQQAAAVRPQ